MQLLYLLSTKTSNVSTSLYVILIHVVSLLFHMYVRNKINFLGSVSI